MSSIKWYGSFREGVVSPANDLKELLIIQEEQTAFLFRAITTDDAHVKGLCCDLDYDKCYAIVLNKKLPPVRLH